VTEEKDVIKILQKKLNFTSKSISNLKLFVSELLKANKKHNYISKSTERVIWYRHILDSAQLVKFINFTNGSLSDLGSGAGFPGLILAIFNENKDFHVKLYEKSPVKRAFLMETSKKLALNVEICGNIYDQIIDTNYIVCRAFKKFDTIIQVSREIVKKPHKLIVLKGQNAHEELNKAFKNKKYPYKLEESITNNGSKIVIVNIRS
tara:strand:+ start:1857 stop:2474 length:618 start_codon:yes stop_codon:yes gene_type:complete